MFNHFFGPFRESLSHYCDLSDLSLPEQLQKVIYGLVDFLCFIKVRLLAKHLLQSVKRRSESHIEIVKDNVCFVFLATVWKHVLNYRSLALL